MEIDPKPVAKHPFLPDLSAELEEDYGGEFTWRIQNYSKLRTDAQRSPETSAKVYSPEFLVNGEAWRILLFPNGNGVDQLSVFLDFAESKKLADQTWHRCVQLAIKISNCEDDSIHAVKDASHRFNPDESDWGFNSFIKISLLTSLVDDSKRPILENDSFDITAYFRVLKDPSGTLWHNFMNWDSKKETGYVGLKNQGATCYMNSLLQSLYFTNYFRKAVFQIPTDNDQPGKSIALALQRIFYNLQNSASAVDTRELTKSFGWDTLDAFMQHDVQEFNRVLQDSLENKMKSTSVEGAIEKLFVGKMKSYIKCVNVDYESSREETFYDIQMNVKGKANLYESFKDYIAVEMLDGENKYQSEKYGLQDAKKGVIFTKYPPVLHLQLKRFEYDFNRDSMVKINDRHEYPLEIDLGEFLESESNPGEQLYVLHGVLVHSGDVHGGHYCAFIRPKSENKWFKFDDDRVVPVSEREVLDENFGDTPGLNPRSSPAGTPPLHNRRLQLLKKFTNAYMLVYIRKSDIPRILSEISTNDIPSHLAETIQRETETRERLAKEAAERHFYIGCRILTDEDIRNYQGFDLSSWSDEDIKTLVKVKKEDTWDDFTLNLARQKGIERNQMRLWSFCRRNNKTYRPENPISFEDHKNDTVETVYRKYSANHPDFRMYMEISQNPLQDSTGKILYFPEITPDSFVVFVKYYDVDTKVLEFVGNLLLKHSYRGQDILPLLKNMKDLSPGVNIRVFEEIKPSLVTPLKMKLTLKESELMTGDIICFQKDVDREHENVQFALVTSYYEYLQWKIVVEFRPKLKDKTDSVNLTRKLEKEVSLKLTMSKRMKFEDVISELADKIKADPSKIHLMINSSGGDIPRNVVNRVEGQTLHEVMQANYCSNNPIFWYEVLNISVKELESRTGISVVIFDKNLRETENIEVLVPKNGSLYNVAAALPDKTNPKMLSFYEVLDGKSIKPLPLETTLTKLGSYSYQLYAGPSSVEIIPKSGASVDQKIVSVFQFSHDIYRPHSVPFQICVGKGQKLAEIREILRLILGVGEREWTRVKLAIVSQQNSCSYLDDMEVALFEICKPTDFLGIDHAETTKTGALKRNPGAIRINNN